MTDKQFEELKALIYGTTGTILVALVLLFILGMAIIGVELQNGVCK